MHRFTLLAVLTAAALAEGCAGGIGYSAVVSDEGYGPDLVYAAPGVQVIADYDEPIFYSDSFYWRFYGGTWYRSSTYTGGWAYAAPPQAVLRIDRPHQFVHYRPQGWTEHRGRAQAGPTVRDRRDDRRLAPTPARHEAAPQRAAPHGRERPPEQARDRGRHDERDHRK
jgi:hypothetical protein